MSCAVEDRIDSAGDLQMPIQQQQNLTVEGAVSEAESEPRADARTKEKASHGHLWALLGLTIFSGIICFNRISHPSMLIDECFTYWRICGSLGNLLDTLRNDAFMPLHYEILNWIR